MAALPLSYEELAAMLSEPGAKCPPANVEAHWPLVEICLAALGLDSIRVKIAALATIAVETGSKFKPVTERGSREYFIEHYWRNERVRGWLGNTCEDDAWRYCGRGLIQTTGRANYLAGGKALGIDLIAEPEKANDPNVAAGLFAQFFHDHHVGDAADRGDWLRVRKIVNGGTNGLKPFMTYVARLERVLLPASAAVASQA